MTWVRTLSHTSAFHGKRTLTNDSLASPNDHICGQTCVYVYHYSPAVPYYQLAVCRIIEQASGATLILHVLSISFRTEIGLLQNRWNLVLEWTLGLVIPVLIAGPICESSDSEAVYVLRFQDYIVQDERFAVVQGFGCTNNADGSILSILLISSWTVILPLISVAIYYRASGTFGTLATDSLIDA